MDKTLGVVRESYNLKSQRAKGLKALHTLELCKADKREERKTGEAGITLIALVVTIIVLIILSFTIVNTIGGENGLFNMAKGENEKTEIKVEKNKLEIAMLQARRANGGTTWVDTENYQNELDKEFGDGIATIIEEKNDYFTVLVNSSQRLYDVKKEGKIIDLGKYNSSDYFTVEFDTSGATEIASQTVRAGRYASRPSDPTKIGNEFVGWYYLEEGGTEEELTYEEKEFDFNTAITTNYSLYAKYTGEAVLMARNDSKAFWQENIRTKITNITFEKGEISVPAEAITSWDVKADSKCADIKAYLEENQDGTYSLTVVSPYKIYSNQNTSGYFENFTSLKNIEFVNFDTSKAAAMNRMFHGCKGLTSLDVGKFDTSKVTNMYAMFSGCSGLTSLDVSKFDTSKVTTMSAMFNYCSGLTSLDVSKFDTSKVTNMYAIFNQCSKLTGLDVSKFDTRQVTNMELMFCYCEKLTRLDVSKFDTSNVTTMCKMFTNCTGLTSLDVSKFDTRQVTNMGYMFYNCNKLTILNLCKFDTSKVTNMSSMFADCNNLTTIYAANKFITDSVEDSASMFAGCSKLVGGSGTKYNASNPKDKTYAHIDEGTSNPGYFTLKTN